MYRIPGAYSAKTTRPAPAVQVQPTRGPPPASLDDTVVRRLLAAGQDLQSALGLMADHPANGKVRHAADELDQVIQAIRDTAFDDPAGQRPCLDPSASIT